MTNFKNIAIAFLTLTAFSTTTSAQTTKAEFASHKLNVEEPMKVKYLGEDGEYLLFHVELQASKPSAAIFAIEDKSEGELYTSGMADSRKVQTVKVEKRNADQVLNFRLVVGRTTYSKSFSVNNEQVEKTTVSETDVTKL